MVRLKGFVKIAGCSDLLAEIGQGPSKDSTIAQLFGFEDTSCEPRGHSFNMAAFLFNK